MKKITATEMLAIVQSWCDNHKSVPHEQFYCCDNDVWVGCDNTTGDCWVEEFQTEEEVIAWLND